MQARRRQFLQQAVEVVVSARRWILLSLGVIWLVTGVLFHFSRTWLWAVTTVMSSVPFLVVLFLLTRRDHRITALSRRLHHLERAVRQREEHGTHATKKRHRGEHNGEDAP